MEFTICWCKEYVSQAPPHFSLTGSRYPVAEMLLAILSVCSEEELTETSDSEDEEDTKIIADAATTPAQIEQRRQQIKNKILAVGKMQRVFTLLRSVSLFLCSYSQADRVTGRKQRLLQSSLQIPMIRLVSRLWVHGLGGMHLVCRVTRLEDVYSLSPKRASFLFSLTCL